VVEPDGVRSGVEAAGGGEVSVAFRQSGSGGVGRGAREDAAIGDRFF
jgi:hypothetical protein